MQYLYGIFNKKETEMKKRITFTLDEDLIESLKKISKETMIPQSKLVEKTLKTIIEQYAER